MTEPTAEARERARFALGPWAERPVHSSMTARAELVANVARALDAFRRAGVEQAEKERDEIRTKAALRIEEARAEVRRVWVQAHNITLDNAQKIMHIAALEAELARVRKS